MVTAVFLVVLARDLQCLGIMLELLGPSMQKLSQMGKK